MGGSKNKSPAQKDKAQKKKDVEQKKTKNLKILIQRLKFLF